VVEDDLHIADLICLHLRDEQLEVVHCADGNEGMRLLQQGSWDALILDLMLPGVDGLEICRRARAMARYTPIIITSARSSEVHRILGLELGADDYLAKPFNPDELMARVKAVLRRQSAPVPGAPGSEDESVTFGDYELSLATRELKRGEEVHMLTTGEFAVLKALVMNARQPLTRDKLMNLARGREWDALERSIDVQISRLRRMIEPDPSKPRYIQTVWGVGYVFVPDGAATK
jgi:two-component system phosphate regulon response regulator OmpR